MRPALVLLIAAAFVLAGCAAPKKSSPADAPAGDASGPDRESQPGSDTSRSDQNSMHTKDFIVVNQPIRIIGSGSATFDAVIPENTSKVTFQVSSNNVLVDNGLTITLEGCGSGSLGGVLSSASPGGVSVEAGQVCGSATPGKHAVTVTNGPGYIDGAFQLIGQVPDTSNSTATH